MKANVFDIQQFSIHDGPGIRTVVFFKGCPLRCIWCANPESQSTKTQTLDGKETGKEMTVEQVMEVIRKDIDFYEESGGGVTLSGGEVLLYHEFATALLIQLHKEQIPTALETTGYAMEDVFQKVASHADLLLFDMKHYDEQKHIKYTGVSNMPILKNMEWAVRNGIPIVARIPVIPAVNDSLEDAKRFCELLKKMGIQKVDLLPFHQFGEKKYEMLNMDYAMKGVKSLHPEDLEDYKNVFESYGFEVKI